MPDRRPDLAIAIPAYEEQAALASFLPALDAALGPRADRTVVCVCDDASTDDTVAVLDGLAASLQLRLDVRTRDVNGGHGPALHEAYRMALATGAPIVAQVDGDGQFRAEDLVAVIDGVDGVVAVSTGHRREVAAPWYRRVISRVLRAVLRVAGIRHPDPNVPLRAFRADVLDRSLAQVPESALVPNVALTIWTSGLPAAVRGVAHQPRIGEGGGTMWGRGTLGRVVRLGRFSVRALREVVPVLRAARTARR